MSGCTFNGYTFRIKNTSNMDSGGTTIIDTGEGGMQRTETINGWDNQDLYWGVKASTNPPNGASWAVSRFRINPQSSSGSWRAEYYDSQDMWWDPNNTNWHSCGEDLSGPTLDKNYGTSAPCSGMRNNGDQWVGDYRGRITFSPGTYVFYSDHDDGARLWVEGINNNNPIMEAGGSGSTTVCNGPTGYYLDGGKNIRVVLREDGGDARIKLWWDTNTATCLPKCYSLNTSANPSGSGWIGLDPQPNCAGGYTDGTSVQLTANPYSGYSFVNWSGDLSGATSPTSITINGNKSVTANFNVACYSLNTGVSPSGSGTVSVSPSPNCGTGYSSGTVVQLTANAASGHSFSNWSGDTSGSSNPASVTVDANKSVTANFSASPCYTLTKSANPAAGGVVSTSPTPNCGGGTGYTSGTVVQLTASANTSYSFANWSGDLTGTTNPVSIAMSGARTVTANFVAAKAVTVDSVWIADANGKSATVFNAGDSISFHIGAINHTGQTQPSLWNWATYNSSGTKILSLSYGNWEYVMPAGLRGAGWDTWIPIDLPGGVYTFIGLVSIGTDIDSKQTSFTMIPTPCYTLSLDVNSNGGGQVGASPAPNCENGTKYRKGTAVEVTATANAGYFFSNWSGNAAGTANPMSVAMDGDKTVTANFTANLVCYALTTSVNPSGGGNVSANPAPNCGSKYVAGTVVQLTANANAGHSFVNWSGVPSDGTTKIAVTMDRDKAMVAIFSAARRTYLPFILR